MALNTPFHLSIETDAGTYVHGFHYGYCERTARSLAAECHKYLRVDLARLAPKGATRIITVALMKDGEVFDTYDGFEWASDAMDRWEREEETAYLADVSPARRRILELEGRAL